MDPSKIIKIGMDIRMIRHSGIGVRIQNILNYWLDSPNLQLFLFGNPEHKQDDSLTFPNYVEFIPYTAGVYSLQEMWGHPRMKEMDLLDIPHFNVPLRFLNKCIVTIHDLIPWVMREYHNSLVKRVYLHTILGQIFKRAQHIITVSNYTATDILREFPNTKIPITTIHNGIDHELYQIQSDSVIEKFRLKYKLPKSFFLTVGIGKGHKNQEFLLSCLAKEWKKDSKIPPIVLAGTNGKIPDYLREIISSVEEKVILLPRIPDEEMPAMYQSALLLIYPSLYEGFGFPVMEASAMSTIVLSSNASVLPEVLGEGAIFFDPRSEKDFSNKLHHAMNLSKDEMNQFQTKARLQASQFRWEKAVSRIQKLYFSK